MDILLKIKEYIKKNNFNKSEISRQMEISRQNFYDVMAGKQKLYIEFLINLSDALGVEPRYWFEESETPNMLNDVKADYKQSKSNDMNRIIDILEERIKKMEGQIEFLQNQLERSQGLEGNDSGKEAV